MNGKREAVDDLIVVFVAGGVAQTGVVGAFRSECQSVLHAPSRGAPDRRRWTARLTHVCG